MKKVIHQQVTSENGGKIVQIVNTPSKRTLRMTVYLGGIYGTNGVHAYPFERRITSELFDGKRWNELVTIDPNNIDYSDYEERDDTWDNWDTFSDLPWRPLLDALYSISCDILGTEE